MKGLEDRTLKKSIVGLIGIYYAAIVVVFSAVAWMYSFALAFFCFFLIAQTAFLAIAGLLLVINRKFFYLVKTGKILGSVNLASRITLFRITMIPPIFFLILAIKNYHTGPVLALFTGLACLSDLFDGYISRRFNEETFMGKILDSSCDYMLLGLLAIGYYIYGLLAAWLFWLLISRLLLHSLGMLALFLLRRKLVPQTTIFGKIAVAVSMVFFVYKPAALIFPVLNAGMKFIEISAGILIALSLADKVIYLARGIWGSSLESQSGIRT
ncbi:MAG: CDP-alcohol phosphatidyltransferase family protein [Treponema sp.]|nr:CDP-alcohol phosphatidyltransferase family protein [Treponema sp.]